MDKQAYSIYRSAVMAKATGDSSVHHLASLLGYIINGIGLFEMAAERLRTSPVDEGAQEILRKRLLSAMKGAKEIGAATGMHLDILSLIDDADKKTAEDILRSGDGEA